MSTYDIALDAIQQFLTAEHPDYSTFIEYIDPILKELKEPSIELNTIVFIGINEIQLLIISNNRAQTSSHFVPIEIIKAPNPLLAAKIHTINNDIEETTARKHMAEITAASCQDHLTKLFKELENLQSKNP